MRHDLVGHALLHAHASCFLDEIVKRLEVLDVDRRDHVDTSAQEILDVFVALAIRTVGRVGMSELINERLRSAFVMTALTSISLNEIPR